MIVIDVNFKTEFYKPLKCEMYHNDLMIDDFLSYCDIEWNILIKNQG